MRSRSSCISFFKRPRPRFHSPPRPPVILFSGITVVRDGGDPQAKTYSMWMISFAKPGPPRTMHGYEATTTATQWRSCTCVKPLHTRVVVPSRAATKAVVHSANWPLDGYCLFTGYRRTAFMSCEPCSRRAGKGRLPGSLPPFSLISTGALEIARWSAA